MEWDKHETIPNSLEEEIETLTQDVFEMPKEAFDEHIAKEIRTLIEPEKKPVSTGKAEEICFKVALLDKKMGQKYAVLEFSPYMNPKSVNMEQARRSCYLMGTIEPFTKKIQAVRQTGVLKNRFMTYLEDMGMPVKIANVSILEQSMTSGSYYGIIRMNLTTTQRECLLDKVDTMRFRNNDPVRYAKLIQAEQ